MVLRVSCISKTSEYQELQRERKLDAKANGQEVACVWQASLLCTRTYVQYRPARRAIHIL
jgi:hypothetical protein